MNAQKYDKCLNFNVSMKTTVVNALCGSESRLINSQKNGNVFQHENINSDGILVSRFSICVIVCVNEGR